MNSNTTSVGNSLENNDKEIKALTELPDSFSGHFFKRNSPLISIPSRNCASPQKLAFSFGDDKPSILGNDHHLNIRHTSCVELTTTRRILSNHLAKIPTLQQISVQKDLNSEIHKAQHSTQDSDSELDFSTEFESEEDSRLDLHF